MFRTRDDQCPLCGQSGAAALHRDAVRQYLRCRYCALVFVPPRERLDASAERSRYDRHQNDPDDPAYRRSLLPLASAVLRHVSRGVEGLDFGCGPGPALAMMLREAGCPTAVFDPFYALDETVWSRTYGFITASEVFEHLYRPRVELDRLFSVLRPGGVLGIMTRFVPRLEAEFADWHYLRDRTHVCFYSPEVFEYIAAHWRASVQFPADNVVLLRHGLT